MVDKLKDAAMFFKAKITKDEIEALMIEATSEDNWQTPTTILHQIANAAYNHDEWKKIEEFLMDKFKSKKWKKILKSLSVVEFLLKNGPSGILYDLKSELYMYKGFETYTFSSEGIDRGEAIRQKAKIVVELLVNQELLDEERVKAQNVKEKMGLSNTYSNARYEGPSSKSTSFQGTSSSSYQGVGSDRYNEPSKGKKYGEDSKDESYSDKIKGGFNQVSDLLKTAYNKTNFNDFGGYIKDKVTNKDVKQREGLLEDDEPTFQKKDSKEEGAFGNFTDYKPPPPSATTNSTSGGLFKNLNVKTPASPTKTTTSNIQKTTTTATSTNKQVTTSNIMKKAPPATNNQPVDLFSFDDEHKPAQTKASQPPVDIFAEFEKAAVAPQKPAVPVTPQNTNILGTDILFSSPPPNNPLPPTTFNPGFLGIGGLSQPVPPQAPKPQPTISMGAPLSYSNALSLNTPSLPNTAASKSDNKWLSTEENNLIDFSDLTGNASKATAPAAVSSTQQYTYQPPTTMTQPVYQAPVQTGMQFYAQPQQQFQANQQQFAIPASQYQQYQQFLQFQQQQALKH